LSAYILAGGALAAAIMSPVCLAVALNGRGATKRFAAAFLGLWCMGYGLTASLAFIATAKDGQISERQSVADAGADRRARFAAAAAELASLAAEKPTPRILERRRELDRIMREASAAPASPGRTVAAVDPAAANLAAYITALGWTVSPEAVGRWTTAFMTGFYEVAGGLALSVAQATRPAGVADPTREPGEAPQRPRAARRKAKDRDSDDPPAPPPRRGRGRPAAVLPADVVARLRERGGEVRGSLADVGRQLGVKSRTTLHRLLHGLHDAGLAKLATSPAGIHLALT
jgi:hypothetical protein